MMSQKLVGKMQRMAEVYDAKRFEVLLVPPLTFAETMEHYRKPPAGLRSRPYVPGAPWGRRWGSAWFGTTVRIPASARGRRVLARLPSAEGMSAFGGKEYLLFVNGAPRSILCQLHREAMLVRRAGGAETLRLDIEGYAGNNRNISTSAFGGGLRPRDPDPTHPAFRAPFPGLEIVAEDIIVADLADDMLVLLETAKQLPNDNLRKHTILSGLFDAYRVLPKDPDWSDRRAIHAAVNHAACLLKPLLACRNGTTSPLAGIVGHAHLDTAWLWPLTETIRKSARTFSAQLALMEEYPEVRFFQSQPCHGEMVRQHYPGLFKRIKEAVRKGCWEPGGAMWVEPDCNLVSGESFIRQFMEGHRFTHEHFNGYESDVLWLPDVFGYSPALPQIMLGCGIRFFVTSKLNWNDTTRFPYDTFRWQGLDGSEVLAHFIVARKSGYNGQVTPEVLHNAWEHVQHPEFQDRFLMPVGHGDGGGGLTERHIRWARRLRNLQGNPRVEWVNAGRFLKGLLNAWDRLPRWRGELYLELHRGTYTSQGRIKLGNRRCELALRNAELLAAVGSLSGARYPAKRLQKLWRSVLTLQFHDVLPGSSVRRVNEETEAAHAAVLSELQPMTGLAAAHACRGLNTQGPGRPFLVVNTLGHARRDVVRIQTHQPCSVVDANGAELPSQSLGAGRKWNVSFALADTPSMGARVVFLAQKQTRDIAEGNRLFRQIGNVLETPFYQVRFDANGGIAGLFDREADRELARPGQPLNTFLFGEDLPSCYDNWEVEEDDIAMLKPGGQLRETRVISSGAVEHRIRRVYDFGGDPETRENSVLTQEIVFYAHDRRIDFETIINWRHAHRLLKAAFPFDLRADKARCEVAFGFYERPTHANTPMERAAFETPAHRWVDLSEADYGVALLNNAKYGHGFYGDQLTLTLVRSGTHPDEAADRGEHRFVYSLRPHNGPFSVRDVVWPAHELNSPMLALPAARHAGSRKSLCWFACDQESVILETVKLAEDGKGLILRVYQADARRSRARITAFQPVRSVVECAMLEKPLRAVPVKNAAWQFLINPFEIKTFRVQF